MFYAHVQSSRRAGRVVTAYPEEQANRVPGRASKPRTGKGLANRVPGKRKQKARGPKIGPRAWRS
jgi:hypothetical protein